MPETMEISAAAKSGDGTVANVGIKMSGSFQCPDCRQKFESEKAKQLHWKFIHDPNRHQEEMADRVIERIEGKQAAEVARKVEEERVAREGAAVAEATRMAEAERQAMEAAAAAKAEKSRQAAKNAAAAAEAAKKSEAAEAARKAEEARVARETAAAAEAATKASEAAEAARAAAERQARDAAAAAEAARIAEEERLAREAAVAARKAEEERKAREAAKTMEAARKAATLPDQPPQPFEKVQASYRLAAQQTQELLEQKPQSADDPAILPHVLKALAGSQVVHFVREGGGVLSHALHSLGEPPAAECRGSLTLDAPPDWSSAASISELLERDDLLKEFKDGTKKRIAASLGVKESQVCITGVFKGSVQVTFTVADLTPAEKENILTADTTGKLKQQFSTFLQLQVSPGVFALRFDLDWLDAQGHKVFETGQSFQVGPPGKERTYNQPVGWTRYGLKVLGKYGDDAWLTPFGNPNSWYRAFHGTGRAAVGGDVAARSIYNSGFIASTGGSYGPGVYISPNINFVENGYAGQLQVQTTAGPKKFKFALQVGVEPDAMKEGSANIWTAPQTSVRPYGPLVKVV